jgi:hypothetical protein
MAYPCIVYALDNAKKEYAGNKTYSYTDRYLVTLITRDPDISVRGVIARLPMCSFSRAYTADNLHHYAYSLYF